MIAETNELHISRKKLDQTARKLQKEALSIIREGSHDPLGKNRDRDTKKKLYTKQVVQNGFALLEKAYELEYFSKDILRLLKMIAHPEQFKDSAKRRSKAIIMMATNGIREKLTQSEIAARIKTNRQNLNRWKKDPRYLDLKDIFGHDEG